MAESLQKYILMQDRVGEHTERSWTLLSKNKISTRLIRGEIFEALPESEQPENPEDIALKVISMNNQNIKLVCNTLDVCKLTDSEANLLVAVASLEERFRIYRERNRLKFGELLNVTTKVFVKVKGYPKELPGVIWYKGALGTHLGTMFGVELLGKEAEGHGTTDGTFRNKKYFDCAQDRGVFVALDKLCPQQDVAKSPKKEASTGKSVTETFKAMIPLFSSKDLYSHSRSIAKDHKLRIDQRVVVCSDNVEPLRGTVRCIAETASTHDYPTVGIELDKRMGSGTGVFKGVQRFVCKKDHALFVPVFKVISEDDFEGLNPAKTQPVSNRLTQSGGSFVSLGHEENFTTLETSGIKRSNSETAMASKSNQEALCIAGGSVAEQQKILDEIKAQNLKVDNGETNGTFPIATQGTGRILEFHEEHFKRSPETNSVLPQMRLSTFYIGKPEHLATASQETLKESSVAERYGNNVPQGAHEFENFKYGADPSVQEIGDYSPSEFFRVEGTVTSSDGLIQHSVSSEAQTPLETKEQNKVLSAVEVEDKILQSGLGLGSMVEVPEMGNKRTQYGVIRWIGQLPKLPGKLVAGLELEEEQPACSDGMFDGTRYFTCPAGRAFFVNLQNCCIDSRFQPDSPGSSKYNGKAFGSIETPIVTGIIPPPSSLTKRNQGKMKGIQGHHNSCYLDATLFSMFAFTTVFDSLLHRSKSDDDLEEYESVQTALKDRIVNPLRNMGFVRADHVLHLRGLLDKLGSTSGLMNEEKDPEEFLNTLLHQVLKSEPLLKLKTGNNRGEESNYYQIITEKDDTKKSQPVQKLLEQSFLFSDLKLAEVPSCLILQMPRFGKKYKMYDFIQPNLKLDITHILENVPRACSVCGEVSAFECKDCYPEKCDLSILAYCKSCVKTFHNHHLRTGHNPTPITVPREYSRYSNKHGYAPIEKQTMDLFAVVCIATSHYVTFVKCGTSEDSPWCFFDSMADRKGEKHGYNIPIVSLCPEAKEWLSKKDEDIVRANENGKLPPDMRRLFGDAYMCLYQNLEMTMYK